MADEKDDASKERVDEVGGNSMVSLKSCLSSNLTRSSKSWKRREVPGIARGLRPNSVFYGRPPNPTSLPLTINRVEKAYLVTKVKQSNGKTSEDDGEVHPSAHAREEKRYQPRIPSRQARS